MPRERRPKSQYEALKHLTYKQAAEHLGEHKNTTYTNCRHYGVRLRDGRCTTELKLFKGRQRVYIDMDPETVREIDEAKLPDCRTRLAKVRLLIEWGLITAQEMEDE